MAGSQDTSTKARLLVVSGKDAPELSVLEKLPPEVKLMGVGKTLADFPGWLPLQPELLPPSSLGVIQSCRHPLLLTNSGGAAYAPASRPPAGIMSV